MFTGEITPGPVLGPQGNEVRVDKVLPDGRVVIADDVWCSFAVLTEEEFRADYSPVGQPSLLGPRNEDEVAIFAEERFRVDLQHALHGLMRHEGVSQSELAARLSVSGARVSQMFSSGCQINVRTLARVVHALGYGCVIESGDGRFVIRAHRQKSFDPRQPIAEVDQELRDLGLDPAAVAARGAALAAKLWPVPDALHEDVSAAVLAQQSGRPVDIERMADFIVGPETAIDITKQTLRALVEKVHYVLNHPSVQGAFTLSWAHGVEYDGPNVREEMLAAQRLLGMPEELPKAEYPEPPTALVFYDQNGSRPAALALVGTMKECFDFAEKYPDENLVVSGGPKNWSHLPAWEPPPPHEPREVDLAMVKRFRALTGCGLAEAKAILIETEGNERKASRLLLERTGR